MKTVEDTAFVRDFKAKIREDLSAITQPVDKTRNDRARVVRDQHRVGCLSHISALRRQALAEDVTPRKQRYKVKIRRALLRICRGVFGFCPNFGEVVTVCRLEVDLTLETCSRRSEALEFIRLKLNQEVSIIHCFCLSFLGNRVPLFLV